MQVLLLLVLPEFCMTVFTTLLIQFTFVILDSSQVDWQSDYTPACEAKISVDKSQEKFSSPYKIELFVSLQYFESNMYHVINSSKYF